MSTVNSSRHSHLSFEEYFNVIGSELRGTEQIRHAINPANGEPNPPVPVSGTHHLQSAIEAARQAFREWFKIPIEERRDAINSFIDGFEARKAPFARLLTLEQGKPLSQAMAEIERAVALARGLVNIEILETVIEDSSARKIVQRHVPLGVVGAIAPWNYPVLLSMTKIIPAVYMGNTVTLKPSPFTPYTGLKLAELALACLPPGVVQALSGDDSLGPMITEHPGIDKISFTGSTNPGRRVMASCAKSLKRVTLELGGNDAAIICDDVDIDAVVPKIGICAFLCSGQRCMAIKRLYVHERIYNEFKSKLVHFVQSLKVGDGSSHPDVFFGPLQNKMQYEKASDLLASISSTGLNTALAGGPFKDSPGFFFAPVIVDNPPDESRIVSEEPFAPMIPLLRWSESDAVAVVDRANGIETGLGASVWSSDTDRAAAIAGHLEAGSVWVNSHFELEAHVPFGGHKSSGIGLEYGLSGLVEYCNSQTLWLRKGL